MKQSTRLFFCAILLITTACTSLIKTKVNTFRLEGVKLGQGLISVVSPNEEPQSLEYAYYASRLETALQGLGYTIATPEQSPEFTAHLNYSVAESKVGKSHIVHSRVHSYQGAIVPGVLQSGVVVDSSTMTHPIFERSFQVVIAYAGEEKKRVYEVTGISRGRCDTLSVVFDAMLQSMLSGFPANNGALNHHSVTGRKSC